MMGETFSVGIGKIGVDSKPNIVDFSGNAMDNNEIDKVEMTLVNIGLGDASQLIQMILLQNVLRAG